MYGLCVIQHSLNGQSTTFRSKCFRRTGKSGIVNEYTKKKVFKCLYVYTSYELWTCTKTAEGRLEERQSV